MVSQRSVKTAPNRKHNEKDTPDQVADMNTDESVGHSSRKRTSTNIAIDNDLSKKLRLDDDVENPQSGVILALGQGDMGQLGLGEDILSRKKPAIIKELSTEKVKLVVAGGVHTACVTTENKIFTFGCNDEFALGRETNDDDSPECIPMILGGAICNHTVTSLTAGDSHTMALTSEGKVFLWGSFRDSHGQLGMFDEGQLCKSPTLINNLKERIISVASGNDHVVMISSGGEVYTMGCGEQGQLGRVGRYFVDRGGRRKGAVSNVFLSPHKVSIPKVKRAKQTVCKAFAGAYCTWVLTAGGMVMAWGLNNFNQLGFPDLETRFQPQHATSLTALNVKQIAGGQHHTLLLDDKGCVYALGRGEYGRLGLGESITQADRATLIEKISEISSVSACSNVSFAVARNGDAYGWGLGSNLQLSTGNEDDEWFPVKLTGKNLENRKVLEVSAGGQHTVLLACDRDDADST